MSLQENTLVSEYTFSETPTLDVAENVLNWWNVCLHNRRVSYEYSEQDWDNETIVLSKTYLYNYYNRASVGESVGVLRFWGYFKHLVPVVTETYDTITIEKYSLCVENNERYSPTECTRTFTPGSELHE